MVPFFNTPGYVCPEVGNFSSCNNIHREDVFANVRGGGGIYEDNCCRLSAVTNGIKDLSL